jgi:hypothetical protein
VRNALTGFQFIRLLNRCRFFRVDHWRHQNVSNGRRNYGDHDKGLAPLSLCESRERRPMTQVDGRNGRSSETRPDRPISACSTWAVRSKAKPSSSGR